MQGICMTVVYRFQSTSPRGGRRDHGDRRGYLRDFNPRPHEGDDDKVADIKARDSGFQSTSPRGGRRKISEEDVRIRNFNPRPHEGDDKM